MRAAATTFATLVAVGLVPLLAFVVSLLAPRLAVAPFTWMRR
ncbi:MAG TPA: hypothetical protein VK875_11440 [Euzebyales bacterium]|nr:hypothetical protein [Euzebyales bacterium]